MSNTSAKQKHAHPSASAVRSRLAALRQALVAHTLKRAIADVASTSERDYRDFGIDKSELLDGLARLRDAVRATPDAGAPAEASGRVDTSLTRAIAGGGNRLTVAVARHFGSHRDDAAAPCQAAPA